MLTSKKYWRKRSCLSNQEVETIVEYTLGRAQLEPGEVGQMQSHVHNCLDCFTKVSAQIEKERPSDPGDSTTPAFNQGLG